MKKTITAFMFFLLSVIVMPVYGQTAGSVQADKFDDEVIFRISGGLNYNSSCDKKKFGAGAGLDVEWQFMPMVGLGLGVGYSSDAICYKKERDSWYILPPSEPLKSDSKLSMINVPLRLYFHPLEWLTFDIGLQWSCVTSGTSGNGIDHTCLSLPLGASIGSTHHLFVRYLPRLGNSLKTSNMGHVDSDLLLFGVGIRLF
jgi:hypothetical protein